MFELTKGHCRHCRTNLDLVFADLGATPISNNFLTERQLQGPEPYYPLRALVCRSCRLVQLQDFFASSDLFNDDYVYFSSFSSSWLAHCEEYADAMIKRFGLDHNSQVIEVASNDGYLLKFFKQKDISVLGVEPSRSVASVAINERGIPTETAFFGRETAQKLKARGFKADIMVANNVLAHVPDINDFVAGFKVLLLPDAVATFEFPHLLNLICLNQFDTIYHEHFSYISLMAAERIFTVAGLRIFDVDRLTTHGGSLRVYVCHQEARHQERPGLAAIRHEERSAGLDNDAVYVSFAGQVRETKRRLLLLLIDLLRNGKRVVAYGAPAKGNTLLNYCGIGPDMLDFTVDISPHKQGLYLPGTRLPIKSLDAIDQVKPDYLLILPWNLKTEIMERMTHIRKWGGKFIVPIPAAEIIP